MTAPDVLPGPPRPGLLPRGVVGEVLAAVLTAVGCVLLAAPAGLVWAAIAPRASVVAAGDSVRVADPTARDFVNADATYLVVVVLAGLLVGLLVVTVGRRHGPGCVVGATVGGLLAAEIARRTGMLVGREEAEAFLRSGLDGALELPLRLRSIALLVGWPVAALTVVMVVASWRLPAPDDA
ncbi:MAG: hypothetical protein ACLGIG_09210 [Actinomycetes bacterium]